MRCSFRVLAGFLHDDNEYKKKNRLVRSTADQEKVKWSFKKTWGCFAGEGIKEETIQLLRNSFSAFSVDKVRNWNKPLPDLIFAFSFCFYLHHTAHLRLYLSDFNSCVCFWSEVWNSIFSIYSILPCAYDQNYLIRYLPDRKEIFDQIQSVELD